MATPWLTCARVPRAIVALRSFIVVCSLFFKSVNGFQTSLEVFNREPKMLRTFNVMPLKRQFDPEASI